MSTATLLFLSDEEINAIGMRLLGAGYGGNTDRDFARAVERAVVEKLKHAAPGAGAESVEWLMQRCEEYQRRAHEAERAHRATPTPDTGASMAQDAMRLALEWLENEQRAADEDCGAPECDECQSVTRPRQRVVDALRAVLGAP